MEIKEWLKIIKGYKKSFKMIETSTIVNPERTIFKISKKYDEKICKCCGADLTLKDKNSLNIKFFEKPNKDTGLYGSLSVFESSLLYMVFKDNILPYDYVKYHECVAGKRFINNIREVRNG